MVGTSSSLDCSRGREICRNLNVSFSGGGGGGGGDGGYGVSLVIGQ